MQVVSFQAKNLTAAHYVGIYIFGAVILRAVIILIIDMTGIQLFGNGGLGAAYYASNAEDPYIVNKEVRSC